MTLKYKIPNYITVVHQKFKVIKDKAHGGGSFDCSKSEIIIGTRDLEISPDYTFSVLIHEISELIHVNLLNTRYTDYGTANDYKFFMTHKEFETHNAILSSIILEQLMK